MNISNTSLSPLMSPVSVAAERTRSTAVQLDAGFGEILRSTSAQDDPAKIKSAAKQFEGLMIGQILKSVHEASDDGWMGTGSDQSGSIALELAEEQFAQAMANGGGLGLAKMVEKGLAGRTKTASSGPTQS
jgi:Rod binding domain-containing protein